MIEVENIKSISSKDKIKLLNYLLVVLTILCYLAYGAFYCWSVEGRDQLLNDIFNPTRQELIAKSRNWKLKGDNNETPYLLYCGEDKNIDSPIISGNVTLQKKQTIAAKHFLLGQERYYLLYVDIDQLQENQTLEIVWYNEGNQHREVLEIGKLPLNDDL